MSSLDNIFLIGFMGCGKSTVGKLLASRLKRPFIDTDDAVEAALGSSIQDIFALHGEPFFRTAELQVLRQCTQNAPAIIATGGGLPMTPGAFDIMRRTGKSVFLYITLSELLIRLTPDDIAKRPLWADANHTRLNALFNSRLNIYRNADFTVDATQSPDDIADAILQYLNMPARE